MKTDLIDDCRLAFEAWCNEQNTSGNPDRLQRRGDGYVYTTADIMWAAWQAAWNLQDARIKGAMA